MKINAIQANTPKVSFKGMWKNSCDISCGMLTDEKKEKFVSKGLIDADDKADMYVKRTYSYVPSIGESKETASENIVKARESLSTEYKTMTNPFSGEKVKAVSFSEVKCEKPHGTPKEQLGVDKRGNTHVKNAGVIVERRNRDKAMYTESFEDVNKCEGFEERISHPRYS